MQHSQRRDIAFERLMSRMPPHIITSFSDVQLDAMREALASRSWRRHTVDIRISIPFARRLYIVLVMGLERRSQGRRVHEKKLNPIWTPANIAVILITLVVSLSAIFGAFQLRDFNFSFFNQLEVHPATVPFKKDKADCEASGRDWRNGECIDYEHNPSF